MRIGIKLAPGATKPTYGTEQAAGADLYANLIPKGGNLIPGEILIVPAGERVLIPTGVSIELPAGLEAQVRPRSGLALKNGITVLNTPGTIDADYRGEIGVILLNTSKESFGVKHGDRIAQLVIAPVVQGHFVEKAELRETKRGAGAFGSTGVSA
ncbi:deoxyuridine 5'-triphosphate nucleotidohydrolase protein [Rhizobium phage RHph_Y2_17_1]|nr:deoxyuridine 5'-triphosphate nucleotidohydrolase protein [Rhizobium phage RHph_Y2_11]QIG75858.1 deoxyuridine 5'-triphosphate nucleotidohydrolase protein [Rhizobium phage RHph_Y2_17_1]